MFTRASTQQELAAKSVPDEWEQPNSNLSAALAAPDDTAATITTQWFQMEPSTTTDDLDLSAIALASETGSN